MNKNGIRTGIAMALAFWGGSLLPTSIEAGMVQPANSVGINAYWQQTGESNITANPDSSQNLVINVTPGVSGDINIKATAADTEVIACTSDGESMFELNGLSISNVTAGEPIIILCEILPHNFQAAPSTNDSSPVFYPKELEFAALQNDGSNSLASAYISPQEFLNTLNLAIMYARDGMHRN